MAIRNTLLSWPGSIHHIPLILYWQSLRQRPDLPRPNTKIRSCDRWKYDKDFGYPSHKSLIWLCRCLLGTGCLPVWSRFRLQQLLSGELYRVNHSCYWSSCAHPIVHNPGDHQWVHTHSVDTWNCSGQMVLSCLR